MINRAAQATAQPVAGAPTLASQASVTSAFNVGWLVSELAVHGAESTSTDETSHGARMASPLPRRALITQIETRINQLTPDLQLAGVPPEAWKSLESGWAAHLAAEANGRTSESPLSARVATLDVTLQSALVAADRRLGRAYALGFDLATLCRLPRQSRETPFDPKFNQRLLAVDEALADLASSLPAHSSRAVSLSLAQWKQWACDPRLSELPVHWPNEGVRSAMGRQGQVWRSMLSGEKLGTDMLNADDYVDAAKTLGKRFGSQPWIWAAAIAAVLLVAGGVFLLVAEKGTVAKLVGSVLSAFGAFGLSAASLKRSVAGVAGELEAQVWGAELDFAIAGAITVAPGDWRIKLKRIRVPPARGLDPEIAHNAMRVHRLTRAIGRRRRRDIRALLHDQSVYCPAEGGVVSGPRQAARRLVRRRFLAAPPKEIVAGPPGTLVSSHDPEKVGDGGGYVWTFDRHKIWRLEEHPDYNTARTKVGLPRVEEPRFPATDAARG